MEQGASDVISLVDGEGNELLFEILDVVPYEGRNFAVLLPSGGLDEGDEVTILEVLGGDTPEEEYFEGISDEALLQTVFGLFKQRLGREED
ncbi:MAG TPA: DUF1292 domain-containing protein [Clostridia bacterium]|nr:DUF1292 domain-containing protein [Clostridia bacterium]